MANPIVIIAKRRLSVPSTNLTVVNPLLALNGSISGSSTCRDSFVVPEVFKCLVAGCRGLGCAVNGFPIANGDRSEVVPRVLWRPFIKKRGVQGLKTRKESAGKK